MQPGQKLPRLDDVSHLILTADKGLLEGAAVSHPDLSQQP